MLLRRNVLLLYFVYLCTVCAYNLCVSMSLLLSVLCFTLLFYLRTQYIRLFSWTVELYFPVFALLSSFPLFYFFFGNFLFGFVQTHWAASSSHSTCSICCRTVVDLLRICCQNGTRGARALVSVELTLRVLCRIIIISSVQPALDASSQKWWSFTHKLSYMYN